MTMNSWCEGGFTAMCAWRWRERGYEGPAGARRASKAALARAAGSVLRPMSARDGSDVNRRLVTRAKVDDNRLELHHEWRLRPQRSCTGFDLRSPGLQVRSGRLIRDRRPQNGEFQVPGRLFDPNPITAHE